jgi:hypothetical protein
MGHQHQRYLIPIPIVVPTPWTEKDQFDYLRSGLVRVAAYTKRFAVDQQAAIEATRHEGGKVYGPYEVWTAAAQLMGLAIVANVTCVTLARLPTASSARSVPANGVAANRTAVESDPPPDPPALPKAGS